MTEQLAIDRAKELFGADHANVQPHAGAQANMAVFGAFLEPHNPDHKVLGMKLAHGGHLTHGSPVNVSGMWFNFIEYEVDPETERLDMDRVRDLALEHKPKIVLAGYTAYPREIDFAAFRAIATRSAPCCGWTPPTSSAWWPEGRSPRRCRTPTW